MPDKAPSEEVGGLVGSEPVSFADLPKARQVRALQAYSESWRRIMTTAQGGTSSRRTRRAAAAKNRRAK